MSAVRGGGLTTGGKGPAPHDAGQTPGGYVARRAPNAREIYGSPLNEVGGTALAHGQGARFVKPQPQEMGANWPQQSGQSYQGCAWHHAPPQPDEQPRSLLRCQEVNRTTTDVDHQCD